MKAAYLILLWCLSVLPALAQTPTVFDGGVINGASFQKGLAVTPGSLISIFGTALASKVAAADTIPLSQSLGGVTVTFIGDQNTETAPLLFVQPDNPSAQVTSQINAQIPWDIVTSGTSSTVTMIVNRDGTSSAPVTVNVAPFSPGIFASGGRAIAVNPDGTLAWPAGVIPGLTTHPAKPGDVLTVYATGLGAVDSPVASGQNSLDKLRRTLTTPTVTIGGLSAQVPFSGLSPQFVGVNQLNITVPNVTAGDSLPLQISIGGIITSNTITIAVSN